MEYKLNRLFILTGWFLTATSCITLRNNFVGQSPQFAILSATRPDQLADIDRAKMRIDFVADSLTQLIISEKKKKMPVRAKEINLLYRTFGEQLNFDRTLSSALAHYPGKKHSIDKSEYYAVSELLKSANSYRRSYERCRYIRRALNRGDSGNGIPGGVLRKSQLFLYSQSVRHQLGRSGKKIAISSLDPVSPLPETNLLKEIFIRINRKNDRLNILGNSVFDLVGRCFFRRHNHHEPSDDEEARNAGLLLEIIRPFDILVARSKNTMANIFIPGYFGHAAIWMGNEIGDQNQISNDSSHIKKRKRISLNDRCMAESVTTGARFSAINECCDAETFIIIRCRDVTADQKREIIRNVKKQIPKEYDYHFDPEISDKVNCTELIFLAFDFIRWKERKYLGKYTVFPDDILYTALDDNRLEIPLMIHKGKLIREPSPEDIVKVMGK